MWIGGYDDWTPAEQREWDRDLEELEREQREHEAKTDYMKRDIPTHLEKIHPADRKDCKKKERDVKTKEPKSWMDLALDDPLFKATFTRVGETNAYIAELQDQTPSQLGDRNLVFEVVNPLYQGLNTILEQRKEGSTIRIQVSSREHVGVSYTCYCTPETWSYTVMDEILEGLNEQLSMKQNLNRGLLLQLSFIKKSS